jgi:hypothetical protein
MSGGRLRQEVVYVARSSMATASTEPSRRRTTATCWSVHY